MEEEFEVVDEPAIAQDAGSETGGSAIASPLSMRSTDAMLGLQYGSSCTQSNPMWMHLDTCSIAQPSSIL